MKFILTTIVAVAAIHPLELQQDNRDSIKISEFGFSQGGSLDVGISNLQLYANNQGQSKVTLVTQITASRSSIDICELSDYSDQVAAGNIIEHGQLSKDTTIHYDVASSGMYSTYIMNCDGVFDITAHVTVQEKNVNSYLGVGLQPLPDLYAAYAAFFSFALAAWAYVVGRYSKNIMRVHWMMLALLGFKVISLIADSLRYRFLGAGVDATGWNSVYYLFLFFKAGLSASLVALIGYGWLFLKAFLSDKDKIVITAVVVINILSVIFQVVTDESAMGSQEWSFSRGAFIFLDLIGCLVLVYPIVITRNQLQQGATHGKEVQNRKRYNLWGRYYIWTVGYVYLVKVVSVFLNEVLTFDSLWLSDACVETVTLAFYCMTGYMFQPTDRNPYFNLTEAEQDEIQLIRRTNDV